MLDLQYTTGSGCSQGNTRDSLPGLDALMLGEKIAWYSAVMYMDVQKMRPEAQRKRQAQQRLGIAQRNKKKIICPRTGRIS